MRARNKFIKPPSADRVLLVKALGLIIAVRLGLWLLPFPRLRTLLNSISTARLGQNTPDPGLVRHVALVVKTIARYIPRATCLTQALVTKVLLTRRGQSATLRIGVCHGSRGEFIAHAWVESNGDIVIGDENLSLEGFTSLPGAGEGII